MEQIGTGIVKAFYRFKHRKQRDWNSVHIGTGIAIGIPSYHTRQVVMLNPTERKWHRNKAFVLWFGAYGTTRLHVYGTDLGDALETCAAWLADNAPGHITSSDEFWKLVKSELDAEGLPEPENWDDGSPQAAILQSLEEDMTYTESGYITSHEWGIMLENPSVDTLYRFISGE